MGFWGIVIIGVAAFVSYWLARTLFPYLFLTKMQQELLSLVRESILSNKVLVKSFKNNGQYKKSVVAIFDTPNLSLGFELKANYHRESNFSTPYKLVLFDKKSEDTFDVSSSVSMELVDAAYEEFERLEKCSVDNLQTANVSPELLLEKIKNRNNSDYRSKPLISPEDEKVLVETFKKIGFTRE